MQYLRQKNQHRWSEQQIRYFRRKYNSEFGDLEIETIEIKHKRYCLSGYRTELPPDFSPLGTRIMLWSNSSLKQLQ